jgi:starch-binding outer membrane protein, SusD/RagB family
VQVERMTMDSCFNYVANTLDSAMINLPEMIQDQNTQMGRITKAIALAVKAQALVTAASPLFNGNITYASFRNKAGQPFFNQTNDPQKWVKAAEACKAAIDQAHINGHTLNKFLPSVGSNLPAELQVHMDIRTAVTDNFNEEVIWGNTNSNATDIQSLSQPRPNAANGLNISFYGMASVPLNMVNRFYTKNGVPINEDKTLDVVTRGATTRTATDADKYRIFPTYTTAAINFDREPRFYAERGLP